MPTAHWYDVSTTSVRLDQISSLERADKSNVPKSVRPIIKRVLMWLVWPPAVSALPPKADMCGAKRNVRFGPIADIGRHYANGCSRPKAGSCMPQDRYWISSSAMLITVGDRLRPSDFADFTLTISSKRVGCSAGRSAGFAPFKILSTYAAAL